ncbi:MAG: Yip1 family protein [Methanoregula sp.]
MIHTIVDKVKGLLINPVATFRQSKTDAPEAVFTYFGVILLVHAIFAAVMATRWTGPQQGFAFMSWGNELPLMVFLMAIAGGFIFAIIFAAWLHLWVYLLGGRQGIMQTFKAIIYGHTPRLLLGWIPVIGFIFMLWSLVLGILGIRELQELSTGKAILAFAIAILIPLILMILLAAAFVAPYMATAGIPTPPTGTVIPQPMNIHLPPQP